MRLVLGQRGWVRGNRRGMGGMIKFRGRRNVRGQSIKCDVSGIG